MSRDTTGPGPHAISESPGTMAGRGVPWMLVAGAGAWVAAVGIGMAVLIDFASAPGSPGQPPSVWPTGSRIPPPDGQPVLLMAAHPRCACTRASLGELARIVARCRERFAARVLFLKPPGAAEEWWRTDLWRSAGAIPGVEVILDEGGEEAGRFRLETSGHVVLYDGRGRLQFSGGITGARGHSGDNAGRDAVVSLIEGRAPARRESFVFGCALFGDEYDAREAR